MSFFKDLFKNKNGRLTYGTITPSGQQYMGGGAGDNVNIVDGNYRQDPMPPRDFRDPLTQPQGIQTLVNTYRPPTNLIQQSQQQQQRNMEVANSAQNLANQQANAFASLLGTGGGDTGGGDTGGGDTGGGNTGGGNTGGGDTGGGNTGGGDTGGGNTGGGNTGGGNTGGGNTGGGGTGGGGTGGGGYYDEATQRQDLIDEIRRRREQNRLPPERPPFVPPMDTPRDTPFVPFNSLPIMPLISGLEDRDAMRNEMSIQRMDNNMFDPVKVGIGNLNPFNRRV